MTHKIAHIFTALFCAFLLMGCQEKIQTSSWAEEPIPIEIKISVSDTEGNNMLDPTKVSNISSNVITASFLGNSYLRDSAPKNGISLWTVNSEDNKPHVLVFGQISGGKNLENEPLVIDWGDGTSDTITIYNKYTWSIDKAPVLERHIIHNGKDYYGKAYVQVTR